MQYLFYIWLIPALMFEIGCIQKPKRTLAFIRRVKAKKYEEYDKHEKSFALYTLLYFVWVCVGCATSQWLLFIAILLLSIIPLKRWPVGVVIDGMLTVTLLVLIAVNKFHLHYSMIKLWNILAA